MTQSTQQAYFNTLKSLVEERNLSVEQKRKRDGSVVVDTLEVRLNSDSRGRERYCNISFYPDDDQMEDSYLLQFYALLPIEMDQKIRQDVFAALPFVNAKTVVGHFGLMDADSKISFKYVCLLPRSKPASRDYLSDLIDLGVFTQALFYDVFLAIENGGSVVDVISTLYNL